MNNLRDQLLEQDGLASSEVSVEQLTQFRSLLAQEQQRAKRLSWLAQIPIWIMALVLLGLCVSESILEHLNVPFVTAFSAVVIGLWVAVLPAARRLGRHLERSKDKVWEYQQALPEYDSQQTKGIPLVARKGDQRLLFWPGVLRMSLIILVLSVLGGNAVFWVLTRSFSQFWSVTLWQSALALLMAGNMTRYALTRPLQQLPEREGMESKFWISAPRVASIRIPSAWWQTSISALLLCLGVISIICFFQGNTVYARVMATLNQAQTLHAIGYGFEEGRRIKANEIWYQQERGTHIRWQRGDQTIDMYQDKVFRYNHVQGTDYAVKKQAQDPLLPRELTETVRYLKWSRRDPDRDRQIAGSMQRCYKREDPNNLSLMWIEWAEGQPRFKSYEEFRRVDEAWEQEELIEIEYDLPLDLAMPPEIFEQQDIRIVEPEQVLRSEYRLDHVVATTEVLGLTFAVHELRRSNDYLFVSCSVRPTAESLEALREAGQTDPLPHHITYGGFNLGSWWQRREDGSLESRPYNTLELGHLRQDGVDLRWFALLPVGTWPGQDEIYEVCATVRTQYALQQLHQDQGLETRGNFRHLLSIDIPQHQASLEQLSEHYHGLAPMVINATRASHRLFVTESRDMTKARFQSHFETLLQGLHPMQELWDQTGSDLNFELIDEEGRPVAGALLGKYLRRRNTGAFHWLDATGHRQECLVSNEQGKVRLNGEHLYGSRAARNALSCVYVLHEKKRLAAVLRISQDDFGQPLRVVMQPACRVTARLSGWVPEAGELTKNEFRTRLTTSLRITETQGLLVDILAHTLSKDPFEAWLVPGWYRLNVSIGKDSNTVATKHFDVPKGKLEWDIGELERMDQ